MEVHTGTKISYIELLSILFESIATLIRLVESKALKRVSSTPCDEICFCLRFIIALYPHNIPEAKDVLSSYYVSTTNAPCDSCIGYCDSISENIDWNLRKLANSSTVLRDYSVRNKMISAMSLVRLPPVLKQLPLFTINSCVDIYSLLRFKPTHLLSLKSRGKLKNHLWWCFPTMIGPLVPF